MNKKHMLFIILTLLLISCQTAAQETLTQKPETTSTQVMITEKPIDNTATPESSPDSAVETGTVTGRVCYPSENIPAMTAYFLNSDTQAYTEFPIAENQTTYQVDISPGVYLAFAWRGETGVGGGYTLAVSCGLGDSCTDHSLLGINVASGSMISNIDLCDWVLDGLPLPVSAAQFSFPANPQLAGMVFVGPEGIWKIEATGTPALIFDRPETILSSDGNDLIFLEANDLWMTDTFTGETRNLTNTPNRNESLWWQWQTRPDLILFTSNPVDREIGPGMNGFLTMVRPDGTGYQVLDDQRDAWNFSLSPDGKTIAYGLDETGWLYSFETDTVTQFTPSNYGLLNTSALGSPAWSPDGKKLAWLASFQETSGEPFTFAVVVFDLETFTHRVLHPHQLPGMDGYPRPVVWSPDGTWLAFEAYDIDPARGGLWILSLDREETYIGGGNPVWKPDSSQLSVTNPDGGQWLVETATWIKTSYDLPGKGWYAAGWGRVPPQSLTPVEGWAAYRDPRYDYGLAIPESWQISPTSLEGISASMVLASYDEAYFLAHSTKGWWTDNVIPEGAVKMDFYGFDGIAPDMPTGEALDAFIDPESVITIATEEVRIGRYLATRITRENKNNGEQSFEFAFRLAPDTILSITVFPETALDTQDVRSILNSIAFPDEPQINFPNYAPAVPLIDIAEDIPDDPKSSLGAPDWEATFENGANWFLFDDDHVKIDVSNNRLVMTAFNPDGWEGWSLASAILQDFYIEITSTNGPECSGKDRYGLVFRSPSADAGYLFGISCDGSYRLRSFDGENFTTLLDWTANDTILVGPGQTNRLGVMAAGNQINLYINGVLVGEVEDASYESGTYGAFIGAAVTPSWTVILTEAAYWNLP